MTTVYLGVGSNVDRTSNICTGLDVLRSEFGLQHVSSAWESDALGFDGPPFLNLAVELDTGLAPGALFRLLRQLEYRMGRPRNASRFSSRTLDIDILTYGELAGRIDGIELPRPELLENSYVLAPMAEIAPSALHPVKGQSYADLWQHMQQDMQPITRVDFDERGWRLPH
jgi:2-amino-4-hydroxy-6-hydroxymethyldihydropteridine diphosphokinase